MKRFIIGLVLVLAVQAQNATAQFASLAAGMMGGKDTHFTVTFLTGTFPVSITLGAAYTGPASPTAEYDAGNGVWTKYTSNTITRAGNYIKFRGDWRTQDGNYLQFFYGTFSSAYTCKLSGNLAYASTVAKAYEAMFSSCSSITQIDSPPWPRDIGSPVEKMYYATWQACSGLTGPLPAGFMDTSQLTGSPTPYMLAATMSYCGNIGGALPANFMRTSQLTGAPAPYMFNNVCRSNFKITGNLPDGFLSSAGMTGLVSTASYSLACHGMSLITGGDIVIGSGVIVDAITVQALSYMMRQCYVWNGRVLWGASLITDLIPIPAARTYTFDGDASMTGYADLHANWK